MYVCKMLLLCCVSAGSVLSLHVFVLLYWYYGSTCFIWDHVMEILPSCMGCSHLTRVCKGMTVTGCNRDTINFHTQDCPTPAWPWPKPHASSAGHVLRSIITGRLYKSN